MTQTMDGKRAKRDCVKTVLPIPPKMDFVVLVETDNASRTKATIVVKQGQGQDKGKAMLVGLLVLHFRCPIW